MEFKDNSKTSSWLNTTPAQATAVLQEAWGEGFNANLGRAASTARRMAQALGVKFEDLDDAAGNNPGFLAALAALHDKLPASAVTQTGSGVIPDHIRELQRSEAYTNPKHPDFERVSAEVRTAYESAYAADAPPR